MVWSARLTAALASFFLFLEITMITSCQRCEGFVPAHIAICPHCEQPQRAERSTLAAKMLKAAGGAAVAVTLMACYGAMNYADDPNNNEQPYCEYGVDSYGECLDPPEPNHCGDGQLDADEQCDDSNFSDGDGCSSACALELCVNATPLALGVSDGTTASELTTQEFHAQCGEFVGGGRERVYQFMADEYGSLNVSVSGGMGLYASWYCASINSVDIAFPSTGENVCAAPGEPLSVPLLASQPVYLVVDTPQGVAPGAFTLNAEFVPGCGDGKLQAYVGESCDAGVADGSLAPYCLDGCALDVPSYCAAAGELSLGTHTGDTSGGLFASNGPGCAGNDDLVAFTAPSDGTLIAVVQADYDLSVKLLQSCSPETLATTACDNASAAGQQEVIAKVLSAGETVWLVVDGVTPSDRGDYNITVDFVSAQP